MLKCPIVQHSHKRQVLEMLKPAAPDHANQNYKKDLERGNEV